MLADRVRIGSGGKKEKIEYIGEVYLAQDDDFVKVYGYWVYRGSELEIEIPHIIQGEEVTSYYGMFTGSGDSLATPVTRVDSNNKNVTSMRYMFYNSSATTLDLSLLDTSNVTDMGIMFRGSSATTIDLSNFDTSNVTDMMSMFEDSSATTLDLSSFDTSKVTYLMMGMFRDASATIGYARTQADADKFNASSNKPVGLNFVVKPDYVLATDDDFVKVSGRWIYRGSELKIEIPHIIQGEEVISYEYMFYGSGSYLATPVTKVVSNNKMVTNMSHMFRYSKATSLDLSHFDTSSVTTMVSMFRDSQATSLDLSNFNTSSVMYTGDMFNNSQATSLDLSSFDTSNILNMNWMFYDSKATIGYARTQADADKLNSSLYKSDGLNFVVKP